MNNQPIYTERIDEEYLHWLEGRWKGTLKSVFPPDEILQDTSVHPGYKEFWGQAEDDLMKYLVKHYESSKKIRSNAEYRAFVKRSVTGPYAVSDPINDEEWREFINAMDHHYPENWNLKPLRSFNLPEIMKL